MVDGYTVEEAASVLGVPRERVWELIARGILTGSTDLGGAMRVRLRADRNAEPPGPVAERPVDLPPSDASPFRELLTEFRSLTERYGQALLALGEARGEVAGLRSRVDMLEARVDLRLTSAAADPGSSWAPSAWPSPGESVVEAPRKPESSTAERAGRSGAQDDAEATDHADNRGSHRRRRSGRRATESFADALARADDPSPPELPGAAETAAALAGLRHDQPSDGAPAEDESTEHEAEAFLPRDLPSADAVPVAEEVEADGAESVAAVDPEPADEALSAETDGESSRPEPETHDEVSEPEPEPEAETGPAAAAESDDEAPEPAWDAEHYSASIEEPGWIAAEDVRAPTLPAWDPSHAEAPPWPERDRPEPSELSGSRELDEALAALDALAHPTPPDVQPPAGDDTGTPVSRPTPPPPLAMRSPASRAYRRLKRIFPS